MCEGSDCPEHGEELCNVASYEFEHNEEVYSKSDNHCITVIVEIEE